MASRFSITVVATDSCDAASSCKIVAVTSDESIPGPGDVTNPDWIISDPGPKASPARLGVLLRAELTGGGRGRDYTIGVSCSDAVGNVSPGTTTVTVAHLHRMRGHRPGFGAPR